MVVMKFGGTSVIDAIKMQEVYDIVIESASRECVVVVLSAMKGTTEDLIDAANQAVCLNKENDTVPYMSIYEKIYHRHKSTWKILIENIGLSIDTNPLPDDIENIFHELKEILHGVYLVREFTKRSKDLIVGFGERLSCAVFSHFMNIKSTEYRALFVDSRELIVTNDKYGGAGVLFDMTYNTLKQFSNETIQKNKKCIPIITGFIAATKEGVSTTLGRNGSDYSAALIGAGMGANRIEIWTDVHGVLSADPRIVPESFLMPSINYTEAMELSYFGANVIHPQAVVPAIEKNIPIIIKNTMDPHANGTIISAENKEHRFPITGLTSVKNVGIVTIEGIGISGNFYFLPRVFEIFAHNHIYPLMITQSSSEHSISFVLNKDDVTTIKKILEEKFHEELEQRKIQNINANIENAIISVIGSHMKGTRGLAGRIFGTMGKHNINVIAIAQGSSEINVSFVVEKDKETSAIQVLHHEFFWEFFGESSGESFVECCGEFSHKEDNNA